MLLPPLPGGRPTKAERPHRITREHPINHHVTDLDNEIADRDKPGPARTTTAPTTTPTTHLT
jgi:hypothetical protein